MKEQFFTFDTKGYNKAKEWIKKNSLEKEIDRLIEKEKSTCVYTYVYLANSLMIRNPY